MLETIIVHSKPASLGLTVKFMNELVGREVSHKVFVPTNTEGREEHRLFLIQRVTQFQILPVDVGKMEPQYRVVVLVEGSYNL